MARSFSVASAPNPDDIAIGLAEARAGVARPSGGVVFVSGALTAALEGVVDRVRREWPGIPFVVVPAAGVLTERGEIEGGSAASGILWPGGRVTPVAAPEAPSDMGEALGAALDATGAAVTQPGSTAKATALLF